MAVVKPEVHVSQLELKNRSSKGTYHVFKDGQLSGTKELSDLTESRKYKMAAVKPEN